MNKPPPGSGSCCNPNAAGLSYIKIGSEQRVIGMMNLDYIFFQLFELDRKPEDATDKELVGMARKFNYIQTHPDIEGAFASALRKAYTTYYLQRAKE